VQKVTENVYVKIGKGSCNTSFVVTSDGVVAIDTPVSPAETRDWVKEITRHGPLRYVINGEAHPDHIAGNCYMGGTLIAHEGAREAILKTDVNSIKQMQQRMATGGPAQDSGDFRLRAPDITFSERLIIYLGKHTFHLFALPGHSPNQVYVYVPEERVIFTSDNVVTTGKPFFFEALPDKWIKGLQFIDTLDFDKIVPGHGEVADKSYIKEMIKTIHFWIDPVKDAIKKGLTLEETQKKIATMQEFAETIKSLTMPGMVNNSVAGIYKYYKK
jgi:cyclase